VAPEQLDQARAVLAAFAGGADVKPVAGEVGWLAVRVEPTRAADVNRALASAGIYAAGLETGIDLESRFLELTGGDDTDSHEGTFFGLAGGEVPR
jgi:hypothetical protein